MEWLITLAIFFGGLLILLALRVPVAFALFGVTIIASITFYGLDAGGRMIVLSVFNGLKSFSLAPIALFMLMGEILFRFGLASKSIDSLSSFFGKVPARRGIITTAAGALFGLLSGSTIANTALLGRTFLEDMRKEGYKDTLAMGTIIAAGGLAMIIPPSTLAIVWGATAGVPIGPLLIAGMIPGFLLAFSYVVVTIVWGRFFNGAPRTESAVSIARKKQLKDAAIHIVPLAGIILLVLGLIFFGVATPTESAAVGTLASILLVIAHGKFSWKVFLESSITSAKLSAMILLIMASSGAYSQLMSYSGATSGFIKFVTSLDIAPILLLIAIQVMILILGTFLEQIAIMLITLPLLMPVVTELGWDPIWFGIIMLISLEVGLSTPPFGMGLFVMRGVAKNTTMTTIYKAAIPFIICDIVVIGLLIIFPDLVTWLPDLMKTFNAG